MNDSILISIKKLLGIQEEYTHFDTDIIIFINGVFMNLTQIGVGDPKGFKIEDKNSKWNDFLDGKVSLESVKTYVYLKVRLLFDPPTTSFVIESMNRLIEQLEWRLNVQVEGEKADV